MTIFPKLNMPFLYLKNIKRQRLVFIFPREIHTNSLQERLKSEFPKEKTNPSIHKVPNNLRRVETNAYAPNIVSIGPYHYGKPRLQAMENIKWQFFRRLFNPDEQKDAELDEVIKSIKHLEKQARNCYSEDCRMSSQKFIEMMMIDGCFIIELLREVQIKGVSKDQSLCKNKLSMNEFFKKLLYGQKKDIQILQKQSRFESAILERWMLPILRQDLIMLENQLPLFLLSKLFELTEDISNFASKTPFQELVLAFFKPLMTKMDSFQEQPIDSNNNLKDSNHLLDLFRSRILPENLKRGQERYLFRSLAELKEAGIKIRKETNGQPLDITFHSGVLKIPQICIDDYKCTLYRNMVAFEQSHKDCKPDITRYLFFLDGLINSEKDVELLHYAGIMQHSLGNNKNVAKTVNKLCIEVSRDTEESYLYEVVNEINKHCETFLKRNRAYAVHNYFTNIWVATSTLAAIFLIYLTVLQTCFSFVQMPSTISDFCWLFANTLLFPFPPLVEYVTAPEVFLVELMEIVVWHYT